MLYVGKADRLRERVRSYFVAGADHSRKVRQAIRLVERIDWDETFTPLEAVVREQELILEHRPPATCRAAGRRTTCLPQGRRQPARASASTVSSRQPSWLTSREAGAAAARQPLVLGPFRGRARLARPWTCFNAATPSAAAPGAPTAGPACEASADDAWALRGRPATCGASTTPWSWQIVGWLAGQTEPPASSTRSSGPTK